MAEDELTLERVLTRKVRVLEPPPIPDAPLLLDLCCGAGGASMGYYQAGFNPVGVDLQPQPNYPFHFIQANALAIDLNGFDCIHASPPCQRWSAATPDDARNSHPDLVAPLRPLLRESGKPYIIENVVGSPLEQPVQLCGSSFGLPIRRHRLFESNIPLYDLPCRHRWQLPTFEQRNKPASVHLVGGSGGADAANVWGKAMGISWMTRYEVKDAIPPAYTHYLGAQMLAYVLHHKHFKEEVVEWLS